MMPELPNISQAYRMLSQEQRHNELSELGNTQNGGMAFAACKKSYIARGYENRKFAKQHQTGHGGQFGGQSGNRPLFNTNNMSSQVSGVKRYYCTHCNMSGHSLERCWKVNGYPPSYKPNIWRRGTGGQANFA